MAGIQLATTPLAAGASRCLVPTLMACLMASVLFVGTVPYPLQAFLALTCVSDVQGACEFEPAVAILGVAVSVLVHAAAVVLFVWSPLSSLVLRCPPREVALAEDLAADKALSTKPISTSTSSLSVFLCASVAHDIVLFGYSLTWVNDFTSFLQAATISFNAPILIGMIYLLAAYRDPASNLGAGLHRLNTLVRERRASSSSSSLFASRSSSLTAPLLPQEYSSLDSRESLEPTELSAPGMSDGHELPAQHRARELGDEKREKMRPFPRMFATSNDHLALNEKYDV